MKKMKTGLTLMLAMSMVIGMGTGAFAQAQTNTNANNIAICPAGPETPGEPQIAICPPMIERDTLEGEAVVKSVGENRLTVKVNDQEVTLKISEETWIIDSQTGLPTSLKDVKEGTKLYVYYSAVMTRSLPPQSNAVAIVSNIQENKTIPRLITVKEIVSQKEGEIRVLNDFGDIIVTIQADSPLSPFKTKQAVSLKDIKEGTQLFVWYDIVAMSYPGQTTSHKTVIVGQKEVTKAPEKITINGKALDLGKDKILMENGKVMVPLRSVSKALGFKLEWDAKNKAAKIDNGTVNTVITVGQDAYYKASTKAIGLTQSLPIGAAPEVIDGTLYIPAELFNLLYSNDQAVQVENDTLTILTK